MLAYFVLKVSESSGLRRCTRSFPVESRRLSQALCHFQIQARKKLQEIHFLIRKAGGSWKFYRGPCYVATHNFSTHMYCVVMVILENFADLYENSAYFLLYLADSSRRAENERMYPNFLVKCVVLEFCEMPSRTQHFTIVVCGNCYDITWYCSQHNPASCIKELVVCCTHPYLGIVENVYVYVGLGVRGWGGGCEICTEKLELESATNPFLHSYTTTKREGLAQDRKNA